MNTPRINLLLVEDNADETALIKEQLLHAKNISFNISSVDRLDVTLARLAEGNIDLIMLDLTLPDSRGLDTFMKVHGRFPEVPIIVLTGMGDENLAVRLVREGAQDYLLKGHANIDTLVQSARYALERNRVRTISQESLKRLRELNETKSQFVSEVSHELRTPLAIIREFVSLVRDEVVGPLNEKQQNCLESALRNCDRLADLINRILDLARIESGKTKLHRIKADLVALLMQFRNDFIPVCQSKKQTLSLEVSDSLPSAHCDVSSVQHILTNLLGNAHKFSPEGGDIYVKAREEGRFLRVDIKDNGPGIPREAQEKIFEAFVQINRKDGPGAKGTGLGLAIAKNLVTLNGGCVSVDSAPGEGSCFTFTIPMYEKDLSARVLIIDDEETVVRMIEKVLQYSDLKLETKSTLSGLDSLILAGEFNPNLIILDMHLVGVSGEEVLISLKQRTAQYNCKILAISGDVPMLTKVVMLGADDFLAKPFSSNDLLDKIRSLLGLEQKVYLEPVEEKEG